MNEHNKEIDKTKVTLWLLNISDKETGIERLFDEKLQREYKDRYKMVSSANKIIKKKNDLVVELHSTNNGLFFATAIKFYKFQEHSSGTIWQSIGESSIAIYKDNKYFDIARQYYKIMKRSLENHI